jgi:hypothetical protein
MNTFLKRIDERNSEDKSHLHYSDYRRMNALRAVTFRLPVTTIAKMKLLFEKSPQTWESKQEMLFEMIESSIKDWIENQGTQDHQNKVFANFDHAARRGLQTMSDSSAEAEI